MAFGAGLIGSGLCGQFSFIHSYIFEEESIRFQYAYTYIYREKVLYYLAGHKLIELNMTESGTVEYFFWKKFRSRLHYKEEKNHQKRKTVHGKKRSMFLDCFHHRVNAAEQETEVSVAAGAAGEQ